MLLLLLLRKTYIRLRRARSRVVQFYAMTTMVSVLAADVALRRFCSLLKFPPQYTPHLSLKPILNDVFLGLAARSRSQLATLLFFLILSSRKQCLLVTASTLPLLYVTTAEIVLDAVEIFHSMPNSYVKTTHSFSSSLFTCPHGR